MNLSPCAYCRGELDEGSDYCPRCGTLLAEDATCTIHQDRAAAGVCILCGTPRCSACGERKNGLFLCDDHEFAEIYQGMAKVHGSPDAALIGFARTCLEQAGLHPYVYVRSSNPLYLGSPEYTMFLAAGEYDGHFINEFKLMVPCPEYLAAQRILRDVNLLG